MKITDYRPLSEREQRALKKMLAVECRDHHRLAEQISGLALRQRDETLFDLAPLSGRATDLQPKIFAVPIECIYHDEDGAIVYVDLFVDEHDALIELEVWKPDGSAVLTYFADADILVRVVDADKR